MSARSIRDGFSVIGEFLGQPHGRLLCRAVLLSRCHRSAGPPACRLATEAGPFTVTSDAQRMPIDAAPHRRFPTMRQHRVLDERFTECAHEGCHARVLLQADHSIAYDDGPAVIRNLQLLCGPHNRAKEFALA